MALITRLGAALLILSTVLPTFATFGNQGSNGCSDKEFWSQSDGCCIVKGGPKNPPSPPSGTACPGTHYWGKEKGWCLPRNPPTGNEEPQCGNGWKWEKSVRCCKPPPSPSTTTHIPTPSAQWPGSGSHNDHPDKNEHDQGKPSNHGKYSKRSLHKSRASSLCPSESEACPVPGSEGGYECVYATDLKSCGGCPAFGTGQDCTTIAGAKHVRCDGRCVVDTCAVGYKLKANECIRL